MTKSNSILSDLTVYLKYSKYIPEQKRRETWEEIVSRYVTMMINRYPSLQDRIVNESEYIFNKQVLPSMRALQFAGPAIHKNESRIYNCAFLPIDTPKAFHEIMFLLLGGTGVGFSVQNFHVRKLPEIRKAKVEQKFLISDSIEGWADAVRALIYSNFGISNKKPRFDYSDIREKGLRLVTAGGLAPGPAPLESCLFEINQIFKRKKDGEKLTTLEVYDIICHIANAVLAGGIRRAALIALFSFNDEEMIGAKTGNWWETNPQRGRANNSAVILRYKITKKAFFKYFDAMRESQYGEPGIYFSNDREWGANPCCEIALRPNQFCNLTEINAGDVLSQEDFNQRAEVASFFGTLQAGFTDFHYLRPIWKQTTEKDALIGVGITGIANGLLDNLSLEKAAKHVIKTNKNISRIIGINSAARATTIKPSGTSSLVLGTSSGIHSWYSENYIRRIQINNNEPIYMWLKENHPSLIQKHKLIPNTSVIEIPQQAPKGALTRTDETALDLLERVRRFNTEWVGNGHNNGSNNNNVSATVTIKENEWNEVKNWMWEHKNTFNGLSILPFDGGNYTQAPFEPINSKQFDTMYASLEEINLETVKEDKDSITRTAEPACAGNACEI